MALKSNGVTQVPDGLGSADQVLKVNSAGTAGEWGTITSGDLTEGSTNLFFTDARADARVALLVDSAPSTLDTLNELAAALGDDANFSTTVTNSIATKLPLAGGAMTGDINFGDNDKAIFGVDSNLQIWSDSTNSYIQESYPGGNLYIRAESFNVGRQANSELYITAFPNGAVNLYHDNAIKLATTSTGIDVTGVITTDGMTTSGNVGIGTSTFGVNGKLQVAGGMGLTGNSEIRQSTNGDGSTLRFLGTQFVAGAANSHSYSYTGGALIAARASHANAFLLDVGSRVSSGHMLKVVNDGNGINGSLQYLNGSDTRFIVKSSTGNVGIGTTNPTVAAGTGLVINGGTNQARLALKNDDTGDGSGDGFQIVVTSGSGSNGGQAILEQRENNIIAFKTNGSEAMRILPSGDVEISGALKLSDTAVLDNATATTTTVSQTAIDQWSASTYGGGKIIIEAKAGAERQITELLVTHNGTTASAVEYGAVFTGGRLATYDVDISGGNVRILVVASSTTSTSYKVVRTTMFA